MPIGGCRVVDERGIRPPSAFSLKYQLVAAIPWLFALAAVPNPDLSAPAGLDGPTATWWQQVVFGQLPDLTVPIWVFKLVLGTPPTIRWPLSGI